jgi:CDP-diacylglycerol--serine O-phosphatidyltransferase
VKPAIPAAVTLIGVFASLLSMMWAAESTYWACNALIAAALCDMVDGRVARMLNSRSAFGEQLDSLADVISFGLAPAWLAYSWRLADLGTIAGLPVAIVPLSAFVGCGVVRLALFNSRRASDDSAFSGIPIPVAALLVVTLVMAWHETGWSALGDPVCLVAVVLAAAVLMVVPIPFRSFKHVGSGAARVLYFGSIGGGLLLLLLGLPGGAVLLVLMLVYVLEGAVSAIARGLSRSLSAGQ